MHSEVKEELPQSDGTWHGWILEGVVAQGVARNLEGVSPKHVKSLKCAARGSRPGHVPPKIWILGSFLVKFGGKIHVI